MKMSVLVKRRLSLMVLGPVLRAVLSALTGYLTAKGISEHMVGEAAAAVQAAAVLIFNVWWELFDRRKAENRGARLDIEGRL